MGSLQPQSASASACLLLRAAALFCGLAAPPAAQAIDLDALWDFSRPDVSEQRMRAALAGADGDEALILQTQIARTHGLRGDFVRARQILDQIEPQLPDAGAEVRVRHALELGRTLSSAAHAPPSQTPQVRAKARSAYLRARDIAKAERLDGLAVDALHMLAFVDTEPADQLHWGREALGLALASPQPAARKWEASLRNNIGHALRQLGRHDEALAEFRQAAALRERGGDDRSVRIAHWQVARTLRAMAQFGAAIEIQLRLERENDAAGTPDPYVFEELEALYRAQGEDARADAYARRRQAAHR